MATSQEQGTSAKAKVDSAGRLLIPAEIRKELGIEPGTVMMLRVEDGELRAFTSSEGMRRAREKVAKYTVPGQGSVDEFLAGRRQEFEKEQRERNE